MKSSEDSERTVCARPEGQGREGDGNPSRVSSEVCLRVIAWVAEEVDEAWHGSDGEAPDSMIEPLNRLCAAIDLNFRGGYRLADRDEPIAALMAIAVQPESPPVNAPCHLTVAEAATLVAENDALKADLAAALEKIATLEHAEEIRRGLLA